MTSISLCKRLNIAKIFILKRSKKFLLGSGGRGDYRPGWHQP